MGSAERRSVFHLNGGAEVGLRTYIVIDGHAAIGNAVAQEAEEIFAGLPVGHVGDGELVACISSAPVVNDQLIATAHIDIVGIIKFEHEGAARLRQVLNGISRCSAHALVLAEELVGSLVVEVVVTIGGVLEDGPLILLVVGIEGATDVIRSLTLRIIVADGQLRAASAEGEEFGVGDLVPSGDSGRDKFAGFFSLIDIVHGVEALSRVVLRRARRSLHVDPICRTSSLSKAHDVASFGIGAFNDRVRTIWQCRRDGLELLR